MKLRRSRRSEIYVQEMCQNQIDRYVKKYECDHEWYSYGHGYKCPKCDFYTGQNKELNEIIKHETEKDYF